MIQTINYLMDELEIWRQNAEHTPAIFFLNYNCCQINCSSLPCFFLTILLHLLIKGIISLARFGPYIRPSYIDISRTIPYNRTWSCTHQITFKGILISVEHACEVDHLPYSCTNRFFYLQTLEFWYFRGSYVYFKSVSPNNI